MNGVVNEKANWTAESKSGIGGGKRELEGEKRKVELEGVGFAQGRDV